MRQAAVRILSALLNAWYGVCRLGGRRREALFLTRQSDTMSPDFQLLARELAERGGWTAAVRAKMVGEGAGGALALAWRMFGDVRALSRCNICFVEGYNPALSLLDMECEHGPDDGATVNDRFPTDPVVMQVWHAAGHFKKFGFEAIGTPEGRSEEDARMFHMHRNYSWIACSGEGARSGFAEAFGYPVSRVVALGHPSFDELYDPPDQALARVRAAYPQLAGTEKPIIVFAPTLRRLRDGDPFQDLRAALRDDPRSSAYEMVWSLHPVSIRGADAHVTTRDLLRCASLLVTDYSSVVYDAAILGVPFAFYTPDIEGYRVSPGLATDPARLAPSLCLSSPGGLLDFLDTAFDRGMGAADGLAEEREAFIGTTLSACGPGSAKRIVDFAIAHARPR